MFRSIFRFWCCPKSTTSSLDGELSDQREHNLPGNPTRGPIVLQNVELETKTKWDEIGATALKKALLDTVMIDAGWLADLADSGGILPRCQDVPAEAIVSLAEMEAWGDIWTVGALIISYPWLARYHPDPHGEQLRKLKFVLKAFAAKAKEYPGCRVGVFWDYPSLPQPNIKGVDDRSPELKARFKRALQGINAWYGHQKTTVLLVTTPLPTGHEYTNTQPYDGRGWCFAEKLMSAIVKDDTALIDMSKLNGNEATVSDLIQNGKSNRPPPIAPNVFHEMLKIGVANKTIKFTNDSDVDVVAGIYKRAFLDEMSAATALYYVEFEWGDEQIATLSTALSFAHACGALPQLQKLFLFNNSIGDSGCSALADAAATGALPNLEKLFLGVNNIGDSGCSALAEAAATGAMALTTLHLGLNNITDDGFAMLMPLMQKDGKLSNLGVFSIGTGITDKGMIEFSNLLATGAMASVRLLSLAGNQIGDAGVEALSSALACGAMAQLQELHLFNNNIGDAGVEALAKAAAGGALPALKDLLMHKDAPALQAACEARGITYH